MIRQTKTFALGLFAAGTLLSGCGEDFATGPQQFPASLDVASWKDTLVLGERHTVTARVLDGQRREVLNRSIEWTVGTPAIVGIAPAEGDASASAALTVAGGAAVELQALQLGEAHLSFVFADELFHQTTAERTVTVVTAGVQLAVESNVAVGEVGDTAVIVASAMGWNAAGESEAVAGLGLQWTKQGPGAVKLLNQGDTVRVVGEAAGTDTLVVSHPACLEGAHCADTLLVTVDGEAAPPADPLAITPTEVEKTVNQVQQFSLTGPAGPYVWSVDGVDGGNATKGTVSVAGLYTAPGSVPPGGSVEVCGRLASSPAVKACATVTLVVTPSAGADVIVVNDIDMWATDWGSSEDNRKFFSNIVNYPTAGSRASATRVMFYTGANSACGGMCRTDGYASGAIVPALVNLGYTPFDETGPLASIPADVKVIFIWMPATEIPANEVNALKQFAGEGGRLVVIGENGGFYGSGIEIENKLLADLGSELENQGDCAWGPGVLESDHQLVSGMSTITIACASTMTPGPNDFVVVRAPDTGKVIVAVTRIDLTPLP